MIEGRLQIAVYGAPTEARTPDLTIKSRLLYHLSYWRILICTAYSTCAAAVKLPLLAEGRGWDLNPRLPHTNSNFNQTYPPHSSARLHLLIYSPNYPDSRLNRLATAPHICLVFPRCPTLFGTQPSCITLVS